MSGLSINIQPKEVTITNIVTSIEMSVKNFVLGSSIEMNIMMKNQEGHIFKFENINIQGDEYNQWGDNDDYIINLILSKLGLTRVNETVQASI